MKIPKRRSHLLAAFNQPQGTDHGLRQAYAALDRAALSIGQNLLRPMNTEDVLRELLTQCSELLVQNANFEIRDVPQTMLARVVNGEPTRVISGSTRRVLDRLKILVDAHRFLVVSPTAG